MKRLFLLLLLFQLINSCSPPPNALERLKHGGELRVLTKNVPAVYYEGPFGPRGYEYEIAQRFAKHLGVKLKLIFGHSTPQLLERLDNNEAHMAAARIVSTPKRKQQYWISAPYQTIKQQLVYRSGTKAPKNIKYLPNLAIEVISKSSQEEFLVQLKKADPKIKWQSNSEASTEELLFLLNEKVIEYSVANSLEIKINQRFYPELRVAFNLSDKLPVSLFFSKQSDNSIQKAADLFLYNLKKAKQIKILDERYYGHLDKFDYVDKRIFQRHIKTRLPKFKTWFERAGADFNIDWILLAAISYQESHWNPKAVSPTGVKGLMMLTQATANYLGVTNRIEPTESIFGGARYYSNLMERLPENIPEEEKIYFALAAYNMGLGHIKDAIKLGKKRGLDSTQWRNLKQVLPLLQQSKWYSQTRYGFARGKEALVYVKNIRSYYDILKWYMENEKVKPLKIKAFDIKVPAL